jgi:hypothetical protein
VLNRLWKELQAKTFDYKKFESTMRKRNITCVKLRIRIAADKLHEHRKRTRDTDTPYTNKRKVKKIIN